MAEILPNTAGDPTQRVQNAIGELLPPVDYKAYGVTPDGWNRLKPRPEVGGALALLYTADNLRARLRSIRTRDVLYDIMLQTSAEGPRMYQEASLTAGFMLHTLVEEPSMKSVQFGVAAQLPESVTHARLLLTSPGKATPLITIHERWGITVPEGYPFVDMTTVPFIAHATGRPE